MFFSCTGLQKISELLLCVLHVCVVCSALCVLIFVYICFCNNNNILYVCVFKCYYTACLDIVGLFLEMVLYYRFHDTHHV